ncbi:MAG: glycosyltransferase family 2 protein [Candidatus Omnitrophota bacterium]
MEKPQAKLQNLSVFFPAYNEQDVINRTIENALHILPAFAQCFEVIAVNDGSTDKTAQHLSELSKKYPLLRIVTHSTNQGYGAAIRSGLMNCKHDYIFYSDSDGQFDLRDIGKLIQLIDSCDIAAGFRSERRDSLHRIINAHAYNSFVRLLFGLPIKDIDCAFKLIKRNVINTITLKSNGAFISAELLLKARKQGFIIKQCAVGHLPREGGKPTGNKPQVVLKAFAELFRLWKELRQ